MIFFKINSKTLTKNPSSISHSITKIQNQDRTMDGTMVVDIIAIKNVVNIEWKLLDKEDMTKLKSEIESGNFVTIDFWDSETETNETMKNIVQIGYIGLGRRGFNMLKNFINYHFISFS